MFVHKNKTATVAQNRVTNASQHKISAGRRKRLLSCGAIGLLAATLFGLSACVSTSQKSYVTEYQSALGPNVEIKTLDASALAPEALRELTSDFVNVFAEIKRPDLVSAVEALYAESVYFNDTFRTLETRSDLVAHLSSVANKMQYSRVLINDIVASGDSIYLRWSMEVGFKVAGKQIDSSSIGMTQIKYDQKQKVVFHQDFWDNTEGFFRHLPVLGAVISSTRKKL